MTTDKAKKRAVRSRQAATGESYTEALRQADIGDEPSDSTPLLATTNCVNCDRPLDFADQGLFCSEFCQQVAKFVRYARGALGDAKRASDPDVRYALEIKMAHLLSGGYPKQERRLNDAQRKAVFDRDGGKCRICGEPGSEIDHIDGSSDDPANLQLLCNDCHRKKTDANLVPANVEHQAWAQELYETRIFVAQPTRLCDDEERWANEWRVLKRQRVDYLWSELEEETPFTRADFRGYKWADVVDQAYNDDGGLPGADLIGVWDDIDPGSGWREGTEEEVEEALYLRSVMERD